MYRQNHSRQKQKTLTRKVISGVYFIGTESCVRLMDVDSDGILDIIVGVVENDMMAKAVGGTNKTIQDICKEASKFIRDPRLLLLMTHFSKSHNSIFSF